MKMLATVLVVVLVGLVAGCATPMPYRAYRGEPRPAEEIAVVYALPPVTLQFADGERISDLPGRGNRNAVELLPGVHTLSAGYYSSTFERYFYFGPIYTENPSEIVFDARPGRVYEIGARRDHHTVRFWVEDVTGDADRPGYPKREGR
jgi:hypothetical protein